MMPELVNELYVALHQPDSRYAAEEDAYYGKWIVCRLTPGLSSIIFSKSAFSDCSCK